MLHGVTTTPDALSGRISSYHPNWRMSQRLPPRKDLAQRVKPMLPSMNLDCRAVLVVVGQTGRKKSHQRIMSSYLMNRSQWFSSFCQISEQPHLMLWCWLVTIMMILYINILYHRIYDSISIYYSFMSSHHLKKLLRLGRTFIFYHSHHSYFCQVSQLLVWKSLSPSRWWRHPGCTAIVCLHFFWCLKWRDPQNSLEIGWCPHFETHAHTHLATALMLGMAGLMKGPSQIVISCDDFEDVIIQKKGHRASWTCCISTVTYWHWTILMSH